MVKLARRLFAQDLGLKLFSLVMATVLWAAVTSDRVSPREFIIPVELQGLPDSLAVNSDQLPFAHVTVGGASRRLDELKQSDVSVAVDVSGAQPGISSFTLESRNVRLPRGLQVEQLA